MTESPEVTRRRAVRQFPSAASLLSPLAVIMDARAGAKRAAATPASEAARPKRSERPGAGGADARAGARPTPQAAALGNTRTYVTPPSTRRPADPEKLRWKLIMRSEIRLFLRRRLSVKGMPKYAVRACGTRPGQKGSVFLGRNSESGNGQTSGLIWCGSVWMCPSCAARIRAERAKVMDEVLKYHLARGGGVLFVTATLPHDLKMPLKDTWDTVTRGWSFLLRGAPWKRRKVEHGVVGVIRALDLTQGFNGWHPHLHSVILLDHQATDVEIAEFTDWLKHRWAGWIERNGYRTPHSDYGLDVRPVRDGAGIGEYVSKVQFELARSDLKRGVGGKTPWELLSDAVAGDEYAWKLWLEYASVSKGKKLITWDAGARALRTEVIGTEEERSDEEIARDGGTFEPLVEITGLLWTLVDYSPNLYADVLMAAGSMSVTKVMKVFEDYGIVVRECDVGRRYDLGPGEEAPAGLPALQLVA